MLETPPPVCSPSADEEKTQPQTPKSQRNATPSPASSPQQQDKNEYDSYQPTDNSEKSMSGDRSSVSGEKSMEKSYTPIHPSSSGNGPQQFCLRWNNYQTNLTSVFDQLLQSESFVDVTLACDGHSIKAHKMVLSACSPYFQALFFDNPCQHPIIIMRDVKWPELKAIVEFMYKGEINVSQDQIGPLLRVAEMLKIRGLAEVNGDQEINSEVVPATATSSPPSPPVQPPPRLQTPSQTINDIPAKKARLTPREWENPDSGKGQHRKRHWPSEENSPVTAATPDNNNAGEQQSGINSPKHTHPHATVASSAASTIIHPPSTPTPMTQFPIPQPLEAMGMSNLGLNHNDDMEIKPGIAEMIREEERAKLLENSHSWLGAPTSSIAESGRLRQGFEPERIEVPNRKIDSYQYQLQSMWQKCWNTNQNLIHHLRFRERGPLKSWRPETMAEAIFSVLKDGLSLSQAARKYDIPYPTFVLYANRVHNMLGPSIDGGTDLRPKGRGRPQRILLGIWPDEHIKGVIKTVVFRDAKELKDDTMHLAYGRHSPVFPFQDANMNYPGANGICPPQQQVPVASGESLSPEAAAAISAVARGLHQQMQMAAAAGGHHHHPDAANLVGGFNMQSHMHSNNGGSAGGNIPMPKLGSPAASGQMGHCGGIPMPRLASPAIPGMPNNNASVLGMAGLSGLHIIPGMGGQGSNSSGGNSSSQHQHSGLTISPAHPNINNNNSLSNNNNISTNSSSNHSHHQQHQHQGNSLAHLTGLNISRIESSTNPNHDVMRMQSPEENSLSSPMEMALEPAVNLAVGVSGMPYKSSRDYTSPRTDNLFSDTDINDLVGSRNCPSRMGNFKEPQTNIKLEPMAECRGE